MRVYSACIIIHIFDLSKKGSIRSNFLFLFPPNKMINENLPMISFFKEVESHFKGKGTNPLKRNASLDANLKSSECFFVFDLTDATISHFGGMKRMFGYELENLDLAFILDKLHPEDSDQVQAILKNAIRQSIKIAIPKYTNVLKISSRFRKSNGEYIRTVSENFIIQTDDDQFVQSFLVRYTDISFLDDSETVEWWVNTDFIDKDDMVNSVYGENKDIFTSREKQIILIMLMGNTNMEIANDLNISRHTVSTHRKNILSKSNCSSMQELKVFCKKNGVFD